VIELIGTKMIEERVFPAGAGLTSDVLM